jgi:hypothetical protein
MSDWRTSRLAAGIVIAVFVLVQLALPISRLGREDAARFGWQMYSVARPSPQFVVSTSAGDVDIRLHDYMARVRADIDIVGLLPPHLCEVVSGAQTVTWEEREHRC